MATRRQIAWMTTTRTLMVPVAMRVPGCRDPRLRHPGCSPSEDERLNPNHALYGQPPTVFVKLTLLCTAPGA